MGFFHARILKWAAISFSKGSSWPRDLTQVSCIGGRLFTVWATGEALCRPSGVEKSWFNPALGEESEIGWNKIIKWQSWDQDPEFLSPRLGFSLEGKDKMTACYWNANGRRSQTKVRIQWWRRKDILPRKVSRAAPLQFRSWSQLGDHQVEHGVVDAGVPGHLLSCSLPRCWCWTSIPLTSTNNHVNNKRIYIPSQCQLKQEVEHQKAFFFLL